MENYTRKETERGGCTCYYNEIGQLHRTDGPALELDGPAIERYYGKKYYFINGKEYHEEQFNEIKDYPMLW